jgi:phosphoglycolate phosphatase-like HAD superfamily hydrolase
MKLKIPEGKFGAYLFDCDGTIVDSMPPAFERVRVIQSFGIRALAQRRASRVTENCTSFLPARFAVISAFPNRIKP